jgi:hypothetical protein
LVATQALVSRAADEEQLAHHSPRELRQLSEPQKAINENPNATRTEVRRWQLRGRPRPVSAAPRTWLISSAREELFEDVVDELDVVGVRTAAREVAVNARE